MRAGAQRAGPSPRAPSPFCRASERVCIGWADAYYVPSRLLPAFARLATAFAGGGGSGGPANAELALPTMLQMLARHSTYAKQATAPPCRPGGGSERGDGKWISHNESYIYQISRATDQLMMADRSTLE